MNFLATTRPCCCDSTSWRAGHKNQGRPPIDILTHLMAPLEALRDEYTEALAGIERVVVGLEELVERGMKGQRDYRRSLPNSHPEPGSR